MLDDLLIPDDKRVTIDLHDMELLEAEYYLKLYQKIFKRLLLFMDTEKGKFY